MLDARRGVEVVKEARNFFETSWKLPSNELGADGNPRGALLSNGAAARRRDAYPDRGFRL